MMFLVLSLAFFYFLLLSKCLAVDSNATDGNSTLGANPPYVPDVIECSPIYGDSLEVASCNAALQKVFNGWRPRLLKIVRRKTGASETTLQVPYQFKDNDGLSHACSLLIAQYCNC